jgi:hypothetical protein
MFMVFTGMGRRLRLQHAGPVQDRLDRGRPLRRRIRDPRGTLNCPVLRTLKEEKKKKK